MSTIQLMETKAIERSLHRLAAEIVENTQGADRLVLVGIYSGGVPLAKRLAAIVGETEGRTPPVGGIDITLYRDDLYTGLEKPVLGDTDIPFSIDGASVVLVDDVLFTGRTVRAALDALLDFGRAACVRLAVLVDRGHRELPIAADFVGRRVDTDKGDRVQVRLVEQGADLDEVTLERRSLAKGQEG